MSDLFLAVCMALGILLVFFVIFVLCLTMIDTWE